MTGMQTVNKEKLSWITFAAGPEARSFAPVEMDVHQVYYGRHTSCIGVAQGGSATSVCLASSVRLYRTAVRRAPRPPRCWFTMRHSTCTVTLRTVQPYHRYPIDTTSIVMVSDTSCLRTLSSPENASVVAADDDADAA